MLISEIVTAVSEVVLDWNDYNNKTALRKNIGKFNTTKFI